MALVRRPEGRRVLQVLLRRQGREPLLSEQALQLAALVLRRLVPGLRPVERELAGRRELVQRRVVQQALQPQLASPQ